MNTSTVPTNGSGSSNSGTEIAQQPTMATNENHSANPPPTPATFGSTSEQTMSNNQTAVSPANNDSSNSNTSMAISTNDNNSSNNNISNNISNNNSQNNNNISSIINNNSNSNNDNNNTSTSTNTNNNSNSNTNNNNSNSINNNNSNSNNDNNTSTNNKRKRSPIDALQTLSRAIQMKQCRAASQVVDIIALAEISDVTQLTQTFQLLLTLAENAVRISNNSRASIARPSATTSNDGSAAAATVLDGQTAVLDLIEYMSLTSGVLCTHDRPALEQYRPLVSRAQTCLKSVAQSAMQGNTKMLEKETSGSVSSALRIDPRIVLPFLENRFSTTPTLLPLHSAAINTHGSQSGNESQLQPRVTDMKGERAREGGSSGIGSSDSRGTLMQSPMKRLRGRVFRAVEMDWPQRENLIQELLKDVDDKRRSAMEKGAAQVRGYNDMSDEELNLWVVFKSEVLGGFGGFGKSTN